MLHRCKKCSDILKVESVGRGEIANLKACHFSNFQFHLCHGHGIMSNGDMVYAFFVLFGAIEISKFTESRENGL